MATSQTYADILKMQFSVAATPTASATASNQPLHKWQATLIDYNSDGLTASTAPTAASNISSQHMVASSTAPMARPANYAAELLSLKAEIISLCNIITDAVAQFKSTIASHPTQSTPLSDIMETDANHQMDTTPCNKRNSNLTDLIANLKYEIATVIIETCIMFQQQTTPKPTAYPIEISAT